MFWASFARRARYSWTADVKRHNEATGEPVARARRFVNSARNLPQVAGPVSRMSMRSGPAPELRLA